MAENPFAQFAESVPSERQVSSDNPFARIKGPAVGEEIETLRDRFSRDELTFEGWKRLKALELAAGVREPDKPGVAESARRIAEQPGQALRNAPGLAAEAVKSAPGKLARGVGAVANLAREAPGAAASFVRETAEDVGRIAEQPGEAARVALTTDTIPRAGEAALRGVTSGAFGLGDLAQQAGQAVGERISGQEPSTPQELAERAQFERERAAATNPEAFFGGQLAGATATGGRLAIPAQRGSTASNITRGAGAGGVTAGAQAGFEGRDPGEAAAVGAVGGAAVPALLRGGQFAARPVTDRLRPTQAAERTLVFRAGERAEDLEKGALGFEKRTLRAPSVAELVKTRSAQRIGETAGRGGDQSARVVTDAANRAPVQRQSDLRRVVERNRVTTSADEVAARNKQISDAAFGKIAGRPVTVSTREVKELTSGPFGRALSQEAPFAFRKLVSAVRSGDEIGEITVRDADDIRQALNKAATKMTGSGQQRFRAKAEQITDIVTNEVPEFEDALRGASRRGRFRSGVEAGTSVRSAPRRDFEQGLRRADAPSRAGVRVGARTALSDATGSPQGAARLARSLAEDESLQAKLTSAFGGDEAARLRAAGTAETEAAENLAEAGIAARGASRAAQNADAITEAIEGTIVLGGRASGAFISSFARGLIDKLRIPPVAARKLAEMAVDRDNVHKVIERLKAAQVRDQAIIDLFQESSAAAGVAADDRLRD